MGPTPDRWFIPPIPKEDEASVKDSITFRLPPKDQNVVARASGSSGQLALSTDGTIQGLHAGG